MARNRTVQAKAQGPRRRKSSGRGQDDADAVQQKAVQVGIVLSGVCISSLCDNSALIRSANRMVQPYQIEGYGQWCLPNNRQTYSPSA